jgi:hypothetical protein
MVPECIKYIRLRKKSNGVDLEDESTDAKNYGGVTRSSNEVSVIEMERRGYIK